VETIQGRRVFKGGNYMREHGSYKSVNIAARVLFFWIQIAGYWIKQLLRHQELKNLRLYDYLYFKTKMGVAGLTFEPHPPNSETLYNF
jgi:hypothetical protein